MTDEASTPAHLLIYGFAPGAEFEGRLVGAIERIESGGKLRVLDVLFVMREADADELVAIDMRGHGEGTLVAPLLGFRLDPGQRRRVSEKALRSDEHGGALRRLGEALEPIGRSATSPPKGDGRAIRGSPESLVDNSPRARRRGRYAPGATGAARASTRTRRRAPTRDFT